MPSSLLLIEMFSLCARRGRSDRAAAGLARRRLDTPFY